MPTTTKKTLLLPPSPLFLSLPPPLNFLRLALDSGDHLLCPPLETILLDGKVHGSLACAGKVRGQTPKVAKQDKKKKPSGRALKRMQYDRRFVTAIFSEIPLFLYLAGFDVDNGSVSDVFSI
ncbi:hypothetical protein RHSIM_Rhsim02G0030500 [Rhododendron simsii]|uniref:40S ribosomal protein S30 n=1 Tax=Rhododendron simsii TaxID=118357 RepID=A0A834HP89_RHOSS|nr:hypothetical protein RHSIM_Rhsim02G0030500 [Rhododendron simsii]